MSSAAEWHQSESQRDTKEQKGRYVTWSNLQSEMWQNARDTLHM